MRGFKTNSPPIGAHTRALTIGKLAAATAYRVCIVFAAGATRGSSGPTTSTSTSEVEVLDCADTRTLAVDSRTKGFRKLDVRPAVLWVLGAAATLSLAVVACSRCCRRRRRRSYGDARKSVYAEYPLAGVAEVKGYGSRGAPYVVATPITATHFNRADYALQDIAYIDSNAKTSLVG